MFAVVLKRALLLGFLCQTFVESNDFLQLYKPKPELPAELNDFLASVQKHEADFKMIRNIVNERGQQEKHHYLNEEEWDDEDYEESLNKVSKVYGMRHPDKNSVIRDRPHNNIYPHMYDPRNNHYLDYNSNLDSPNGKYSKHIKSPIRLRRELDVNNMNNNVVELNHRGENGEINRKVKFPERRHVVESQQHRSVDVSSNNKPRSVEIDVKSEGKLVKQIKESTNQPKSIVLNINTDQLNPIQKQPEVRINSGLLTNNNQQPTSKTVSPVSQEVFNIESFADQTNPKKEISNNYNVLFSANEQLNTDRSLANQMLTAHTDNPFVQQNSEHLINFDDMSQLWTPQEKSEMEKGVEISQSKTNAIIAKDMSKSRSVSNEENAGFEQAKTLTVDNPKGTPRDDDKRQLIRGHMSSQTNEKNIFQPDVNVLNNGVLSDSVLPVNEAIKLGQAATETFEINAPKKYTDSNKTSVTPANSDGRSRKYHSQSFNGVLTAEEFLNERKKEASLVGPEDADLKRLSDQLVCDSDSTTVQPQTIEILIPANGGIHQGCGKDAKIGVKIPVESGKNIPKRQHLEMDKRAGGSVEENGKIDTRMQSAIKSKNRMYIHHRKHHPFLEISELEDIYSDKEHEDCNKDANEDSYGYKDYEKNGDDSFPDYTNNQFTGKRYKFKPYHTKKRVHRHPRTQNFQNSNAEDNFSYKTRHLHAVQKVYDSNDYAEYINSDYEEQSTHSRMMYPLKKRKQPAEGDYMDEEDSDSSRDMKKKFDLVKKSDNEFANPVATTEEDDGYYDYYRHSESKMDENRPVNPVDYDKLIKPQMHEQEKETTTYKMIPISTYRPILDEIVSHSGRKRKHKHINKDNVHRLKPFKKFLKHKGIADADEDVFLRNNPEFHRWPKFVLYDRMNEELIKKRATEAIQGSNEVVEKRFPLSAQNFFVSRPRRGPEKPQEIKRNSVIESTQFPPISQQIVRQITTDSAAVAVPVSTSGEIESPRENLETTVESIGNTTDNGNEECDTVTNPCDSRENFNHSTVMVTTLLSIENENETEKTVLLNDTRGKEIYIKLDDILSGDLPSRIVTNIFETVKEDPKLRKRLSKGLKRGRKKPLEVNSDTDNQYETREILYQMNILMGRLQESTTCQRLPEVLRLYLNHLTKSHQENALTKTKEMEEVNFDENQNPYMFQSSSDSLEGKITILKDLLEKYNNLPERCKVHAAPVKEYIENHLGMLTNMVDGNAVSDRQNGKAKKSLRQLSDTSHDSKEDVLVQEQLNSLGLGNQGNFNPNFDLNKIIEENKKNSVTSTDKGVIKREVVRPHNTVQFKRLLEAVNKAKMKRESEKKIGEIFGRISREDDEYYEGLNGKNRAVRHAKFESPVVFSL